MFQKIQKIERIKDKNNWETIAVKDKIEKTNLNNGWNWLKKENKKAKNQIVKGVTIHGSVFN